MSNKLYYAIITRNGWCKLHVSRDKKEVLELQALSRKIPIHSNLLGEFMLEAKREMEQYKAVDVTGEVPVSKDAKVIKQSLVDTAPKMLAALKEAVQDCGCSVRERESGHRVGCQAPYWQEIIEEAEGR